MNVWLQGNNGNYHLEIMETDNPTHTIDLLLRNQHFLLLQHVPNRTYPAHIITKPIVLQNPQIQLEDDIHKSESASSSMERGIGSENKRTSQTFKQAQRDQKILNDSRKLGITCDMPQDNEDPNERKKRVNRNVQKIKVRQGKLAEDLREQLPPPPPLTDDDHYNIAMNSIRAFELEQMSYSFSCCQVCQERRLQMKMVSDTVCRRCFSDKDNIKMFSAKNNMDPGTVPQELQGLTLVEAQLISRITPSINVHMLKHGGVAANGHCVTFPQAVEEMSKILPRLPEEINILRVRREGKNDTSREFSVRRKTVHAALQWLKTNNSAFFDIEISHERLMKLPENGELLDLPTMQYTSQAKHIDDRGPAPEQNSPGNSDESEMTSSGVLLPEPSVDIRREVEQVVEEVVGANHGEVSSNRRGIITIPWPTRGNVPLSEFTTRHFFTLAFPTLFPYALGDFYINRPRTCKSMSDWAEHLLWYRDGRFAGHKYFKFIVHNMIVRKQALERTSFIMNQTIGDDHMTVADLKAKIESGDASIGKRILYFGATLRGTSQYWGQKAKELRSLIQYQINEKKGLPSFFTTGSCAEYHFKPLRRILESYVLETTGKVVNLSDRNLLYSTLQSNSHIIGHYFDLRTTSYFEKVMRPVFGVDAYWYRQEFAKSRGMIHWHGLCWRHDKEPHDLLYQAVQAGLTDEDMAQNLSDWAKNVFGMTALHPAGKDSSGNSKKYLWPPPEGTAPPPPEEMNPLLKLMMDVCQDQQSILEDHLLLTNRINLHRCSDYCLKPSKGKTCNSNRKCRMEFGTTDNPGKTLRSEPAIVRDKNKSMRLEMERDHPMLVQHSKYHTQAWRANGDVSIILSKSGPDNPSIDEIVATEKYVSGYACKGNEPSGAAADLFNDLVNCSDEDSTAKSICTKVLMGTVKRDVSATETTYEISGLPLYRSSHTFQSVSVTGARLLEKGGKRVTKHTPLDKYLARDPKDTDTSWYNFVCRTGKVPVISGGHIRSTWPLTEEYCRTMILLHWPGWRKVADIKNDTQTWIEIMISFLSTDKCPNFLKADVERAKKGEKTSLDEDENNNLDEAEEEPDWMDLVRPNAEYPDADDFNYDDGGPDFNWSAAAHHYPSQYSWLEKANEEFKKDKKNNVQLDLPELDLDSMNEEQQFAFNLVMDTLIKFKEDPNKFDQTLRLIVSGTAGSGKSHLINCIVKAIRVIFNDNKAVQVLGPTGSSANLVSGTTIHTFLKIPTKQRANQEMKQPDGSVGRILQENCEGLLALLVDERSLVGCNTLGWMENHCRYGVMKGANASKSWGGLPVVVFFGDDVQLPPVCDQPVYKPHGTITASVHGAMVWKEFTNAVILNKIIRQNQDQQEFKDTLTALRNYELTIQQARWLQAFQWDSLRRSHGDDLLKRMTEDGLFVFPTHAEEWIHNRTQLLAANAQHPVARLKAVSSGTHSNYPSDKAGGLERELFLCKGAKVMLTGNLNVTYGLFNGAVGIVNDIIYLEGKNPTMGLPDVVMVQFYKYTGPQFIANSKIIPIVPIERRMDCPCHGCKRTQIPLRLGWGTTIHRCQGMTIGVGQPNRYIVISPGTRAFESRNPGALFVALSRAKTAGDPQNDPDFAWHPNVFLNEDRLCHAVRTPTTSARADEIARIRRISQITKRNFYHLFGNMQLVNIVKELHHQIPLEE